MKKLLFIRSTSILSLSDANPPNTSFVDGERTTQAGRVNVSESIMFDLMNVAWMFGLLDEVYCITG